MLLIQCRLMWPSSFLALAPELTTWLVRPLHFTLFFGSHSWSFAALPSSMSLPRSLTRYVFSFLLPRIWLFIGPWLHLSILRIHSWAALAS